MKLIALLSLVLSGCSTPRTPSKAPTAPFGARLGYTLEHVATASQYVIASTWQSFALATVTLNGPTISIRFFDVQLRQPAPLVAKPPENFD